MKPSLLLALVASAGLGAIVGLVRQWSEQTDTSHLGEYSGVRTFTLWSVLGCIAAFLSDQYVPAVLPVTLAAVSAQFILRRAPTATEANRQGSTTFVAALVTVSAGALVYWQHRAEAVLVSALTSVLLGLKNPIHAWTRAFTETDIRATLQFVAITGVILPLAPNRDLGPFGAFNPYATWLMVVLVSGIGFVGYVAMRLSGPRVGLYLASVLGGISSSTAATLAFSRRSREDSANAPHYATAVIIACTIMLPRLIVAVSFVNRPLALHLLAPLGLMALPGLGYAVWNWRRHRERQSAGARPAISNPLGLTTAIGFGALFAVLNFAVKTAAHFDSLQRALSPLAFISGLGDVDAIALAVASRQGISPDLAVHAIILAAIANSLLKAGLAIWQGAESLRWPVAISMTLTIACGVAWFWFGPAE